MRREGLQARGIYKEVLRPSRGLALAAAKRSLILPPPSLGLAPSPYLNELISIYKKVSNTEALPVQGNGQRPAKQPR